MAGRHIPIGRYSQKPDRTDDLDPGTHWNLLFFEDREEGSGTLLNGRKGTQCESGWITGLSNEWDLG